eukprot:366522-Chlamydomonas_euryale.AAC.19
MLDVPDGTVNRQQGVAHAVGQAEVLQCCLAYCDMACLGHGLSQRLIDWQGRGWKQGAARWTHEVFCHALSEVRIACFAPRVPTWRDERDSECVVISEEAEGTAEQSSHPSLHARAEIGDV